MKTMLMLCCLVLWAPGFVSSGAEWVELTPASGPAPSPRLHAASIYDPAGHRMIVFGGSSGTGDVGDVWAFDLDLASWTELSAGGGPVGRITANAVYDDLEQRMLIWAGQASGVFQNDVWAFDLATNGWTELLPPDPKPNIRYGTAAVLDPVTRDLVTFAGFTSAGRFDDTWRFGIDGVNWVDVSPATDPGRRCLHSASLDQRGRRMIMYGGQRSAALDDIWALDLASGQWTNMTPTSRPPGRFFAAQVYDPRRHSATVFGGNSNGTRKNDVWMFDLATESWAQLTPTGTAPTPREGATAIYVVNEDRLVTFGGGTPTRQGDIWSLELDPGADLVFIDPVTQDGTAFRWPVSANVDWVRGDIADVADYTTHLNALATWATAIEDLAVPAAGTGYWYLMRLAGDRGSWQSTPGAEVGRDAALP